MTSINIIKSYKSTIAKKLNLFQIYINEARIHFAILNMYKMKKETPIQEKLFSAISEFNNKEKYIIERQK
jgi:hypothetical protein